MIRYKPLETLDILDDLSYGIASSHANGSGLQSLPMLENKSRPHWRVCCGSLPSWCIPTSPGQLMPLGLGCISLKKKILKPPQCATRISRLGSSRLGGPQGWTTLNGL